MSDDFKLEPTHDRKREPTHISCPICDSRVRKGELRRHQETDECKVTGKKLELTARGWSYCPSEAIGKMLETMGFAEYIAIKVFNNGWGNQFGYGWYAAEWAVALGKKIIRAPIVTRRAVLRMAAEDENYREALHAAITLGGGVTSDGHARSLSACKPLFTLAIQKFQPILAPSEPGES